MTIGVGSMILYFFPVEFIFLHWIDNWGPVVGWIIRIAMAVVGGGIWLLGRGMDANRGGP